MHGRCDSISKSLQDTTSEISDKVRMNYKELHEFTTEVEKHMLASIRQLNNTFVATKMELTETLNERQDRMKQMFDSELSQVKERYAAAVDKVEKQSKTLQELFRKKVRSIKEKSALFYAKVEMKLKEMNDEVVEVSNMYRFYQETIQGPTQKYEAQIHTLKTAVNVTDQDRVVEFALLKDAIDNILRALTEKTRIDIVAGASTNDFEKKV